MQYSSDRSDHKSLSLINSYLSMGRIEQAEAEIKSALADDPNDSSLIYLLAYCRYLKDDYIKAIDLCIESMSKGYSAQACSYLLGRIYMDSDRYVKAEENLLESLRLDPKDAKTLAAYSMLMLKTGHERKAVLLMDEALRIDPEDKTVLRFQFLFNIFMSDKSAQLSTLKHYVNSAGSEVLKHINIGLYNIRHKKYKKARENFREAFMLNPTDPYLLTMMEELDRLCHWIFAPNIFMNKIGGAGVVWIICSGLLLLLRWLVPTKIFFYVVLIYILFVIYTWTAPLLYKLIIKIKGDR